MSNKDQEDDLPMDDDGRVEYQKWNRINAFMRHLQEMHFLHQQNIKRQFLKNRNEMLEDLDMVDNVVDMMDEYPEAENIINKILRRLDNDKRY